VEPLAPPSRTIDGPARSGIASVIHPEHKLLIHLNRFPNALNSKRPFDSPARAREQGCLD
jgi:hypothetical protein